MFEKDLIYICECYEEWPKGVTCWFYCDDGEVLGGGFSDYPVGVLQDPKSNPDFVRAAGYNHTGKDYTQEDFLKCKEYLTNKNTSVEEGTDHVIEKVKLRIQEITKRHEQALADELKPLIEVLQRKGEIL